MDIYFILKEVKSQFKVKAFILIEKFYKVTPIPRP